MSGHKAEWSKASARRGLELQTNQRHGLTGETEGKGKRAVLGGEGLWRRKFLQVTAGLPPQVCVRLRAGGCERLTTSSTTPQSAAPERED